MNFDVKARTILLVRHGSHAYGTNVATSDEDFKGVCIKPKRFYFGYLNNFEQAEQMASKEGQVDSVVYSIEKFVKLAADMNPNIVEVLHGDKKNIIVCDEFGEELLAFRDSFTSKKARHTFSGYAHAQLKRINLHRSWLLNPEPTPPRRIDFNLPERTVIPADQIAAAMSAITKQVDLWSWHELEGCDASQRLAIQSEFTRRLVDITKWSWEEHEEKVWLSAAKQIGLDTNFIELLDKERRYNSKLKNHQSYVNWVKTRNPARAELEAKFGYDVKHGGHLIRLMRMCKEILSTGQVVVLRPDREDIIAIREGKVSYNDLIEQARVLDEECEALYRTSTLRHAPDRNAIDEFLVDITERYLNKHG